MVFLSTFMRQLAGWCSINSRIQGNLIYSMIKSRLLSSFLSNKKSILSKLTQFRNPSLKKVLLNHRNTEYDIVQNCYRTLFSMNPLKLQPDKCNPRTRLKCALNTRDSRNARLVSDAPTTTILALIAILGSRTNFRLREYSANGCVSLSTRSDGTLPKTSLNYYTIFRASNLPS